MLPSPVRPSEIQFLLAFSAVICEGYSPHETSRDPLALTAFFDPPRVWSPCPSRSSPLTPTVAKHEPTEAAVHTRAR